MSRLKTQQVQFIRRAFDLSTRDMYGVDDVVRLCLVALCTEGHVLLEGNPGLGKTSLVRTMARVLKLPSGRIQFTPDLMPSDITGTLMPKSPGENGAGSTNHGFDLEFQPGPIFTAFLLADEINRATPKTQSAMLEAMAERQVTVLGKTHPLDSKDFTPFTPEGNRNPIPPQEGRPFIVLATQNPIDYEGTYDLPKAQSDRFMFKVNMPVPDRKVMWKIMEKDAGVLDDSAYGGPDGEEQPTPPWSAKDSVSAIRQLCEEIRTMKPLPAVVDHIMNIYLATNRQVVLNDRQRKLSEHFSYGLGPRAATALTLGAKGWTLLFSDDVAQADGVALAKILIPTLRHRVGLKYGWQDSYRKDKRSDVPESRVLEHFLSEFAQACMPTGNRTYVQSFTNTIDRLVQERTC